MLENLGTTSTDDATSSSSGGKNCTLDTGSGIINIKKVAYGIILFIVPGTSIAK
jgi:hypothetical protein